MAKYCTKEISNALYEICAKRHAFEFTAIGHQIRLGRLESCFQRGWAQLDGPYNYILKLKIKSSKS